MKSSSKTFKTLGDKYRAHDIDLLITIGEMKNRLEIMICELTSIENRCFTDSYEEATMECSPKKKS